VRDHPAPERLHHEERAGQADLDHAAPVLGRKIRERRGRHLDGAVDEAIGRAEGRDRAPHGRFAIGRVAHVGLLEHRRVADVRGKRAPAFRIDIGEHDTAAALHEAPRHRLADTRAPPVTIRALSSNRAMSIVPTPCPKRA
jgi:hypothetical protein